MTADSIRRNVFWDLRCGGCAQAHPLLKDGTAYRPFKPTEAGRCWRTRTGQRADSPDSPLRPAPAGRCAHSRERNAAAGCPSRRPGIEKPRPDQTPQVRGLTRVQGPPHALDCQHRQPRGLARFKLGSGTPRRFPTVTQRPSPHGTGLAACPVDPLTQWLEGPGTGRSGAGGMPGRTHFRPGHGPGAAVRGSQGPTAARFSVRPTPEA